MWRNGGGGGGHVGQLVEHRCGRRQPLVRSVMTRRGVDQSQRHPTTHALRTRQRRGPPFSGPVRLARSSFLACDPCRAGGRFPTDPRILDLW